ncbi:RIP metalloprotease RseP [Porphyromonas sp. COT-239 OH1446]|uniref:RIP metalloprotease RseP n=1 Tax=Porphyromonas sp. COT-239 OH1446 TaxID=1515613 RepID=UPI00052C34A9|nr:RIP metalloprotease RseP [Porphyromonas sp. COT-239 OH1446]KGN72090.1 zinc metalloprotease [Porphyromonas sp. COT-239 OH1446]
MNTVLQLLASLSLLVFIHELGHFAFARLFGARVERFYLFFHPWFSIFKYRSKRSGTVYGLGWLPLGGYCTIAGMIDETLDAKGLQSTPKPDEFRSKKAYERLLIMAGGVIFNLLLAWLIYSAIAFTWGDKYLSSSALKRGYSFSQVGHQVGFKDGDIILSTDSKEELNALSNRFVQDIYMAREVRVLRQDGQIYTIELPSDMLERIVASEESLLSLRFPFVIDSVVKKSSLQAGLRSGQRIEQINGVVVGRLEDMYQQLKHSRGGMAEVGLYDAEAQEMKLMQIPVDSTGLLGISFRPLQEVYADQIQDIRYSLLGSIPAGLSRATSTVSNYVSSLKLLFTREGVKQVGGLGTMGKLFPQQFDWANFWSITAFLSIILAVMNLLPIPALDGGHILFIFIEILRGGKKLSDRTMMRIQTVGLVIMLLLMIYANANDIYRYLLK